MLKKSIQYSIYILSPLLVLSLIIILPIIILISLILYILLVVSFAFYKIFVIISGFFALCILYCFWKKFRRKKAVRFILVSLACFVLVFVTFMTVPEFNLLLTLPIRQQVVKNNRFKTDDFLVNALLGEVTEFHGSGNVYFRFFSSKGGWVDRVFIVYTTNPAPALRRQTSTRPHHIKTWRKLRKNWYFLETRPLAD